MTLQGSFTPPHNPASTDGILKLAIMAVGGQGGGVLTNWVEDCARESGYAVQATSVAGVAQRTGATIYYLEMAPASESKPVFSLMPAAGDVDVLVAAELMEAGRGILRGFVTPDRTTLIASTHRALAVSEKTVPGDGIADRSEVLAAAEVAARHFIKGDLNKAAIEEGSVISASLFGALAGSGTLPFAPESFRAAIERSGRGVAASLRAFERGFAIAQGTEVPDKPASTLAKSPDAIGPKADLDRWHRLCEDARAIPAECFDMLHAGLRKTVDFQDVDYGRAYLEEVLLTAKEDDPSKGYAFTLQLAKHLANAMCYDDIIRVADRKIRKGRYTQIEQDMGMEASQKVDVTEYFHPRAEEICGLMPRKLGAWIEARPRVFAFLDRRVNQGRRLTTTRLWPYLQLHYLAGLKPRRRKSLRHSVEQAHWQDWLTDCRSVRDADYDLGVELLKNRRLIKGYSDTHTRGLGKFDKVMSAREMLLGREDAANWMHRLREAALQDEQGDALDGALKTVRSFV